MDNDLDIVYLTDISGTIGQWLDMEFDDEVPYEIIELLEKVYSLTVKQIS